MTTGTTASGTYYLFNKKDQEVPIVFIHGVGLTHEIWQPQLEFFNYYSTLAYDILGHGKSSLEKIQITFDDFSEQLIELMDHLNIKKIHLVGFSIGSLIARNFATKHNKHLHTLTLLCSGLRVSNVFLLSESTHSPLINILYCLSFFIRSNKIFDF